MCHLNFPYDCLINKSSGTKMNLYTVKFFAKAIKFGSKHVYQTIPRILTIWLDMGENKALSGNDVFAKLNSVVARAIKDTPMYKVRLYSSFYMTPDPAFSGTRLSRRLFHVWGTATRMFMPT